MGSARGVCGADAGVGAVHGGSGPLAPYVCDPAKCGYHGAVRSSQGAL